VHDDSPWKAENEIDRGYGGHGVFRSALQALSGCSLDGVIVNGGGGGGGAPGGGGGSGSGVVVVAVRTVVLSLPQRRSPPTGRRWWRRWQDRTEAQLQNRERTGVPARAARVWWWMRPDHKLNYERLALCCLHLLS